MEAAYGTVMGTLGNYDRDSYLFTWAYSLPYFSCDRCLVFYPVICRTFALGKLELLGLGPVGSKGSGK